MMVKWNILPLVLAVGTGLLTGCQNNIHVRVEKVLHVSSVSRNSRIGRQLYESIDNLNAIIDSCEDAQAAKWDFIRSFPLSSSTGPTRADVSTQLRSYSTALESYIGRSREWRRECEAYFEPVEEVRAPADPRITLRRIGEFCERSHGELGDWPEVLANVEVVNALAKTGPSVDFLRSVRGSEEAMKEQFYVAARTARTRFGGFQSTDVYRINPSDPMYEKILGTGCAVGAVLRIPFSRTVSLEKLTDAKVCVSGDSAIMLVMEHPGQVRVYQVQMDPTQITRNIGLLISKATAAGAKYMTAGVAP